MHVLLSSPAVSGNTRPESGRGSPCRCGARWQALNASAQRNRVAKRRIKPAAPRLGVDCARSHAKHTSPLGHARRSLRTAWARQRGGSRSAHASAQRAGAPSSSGCRCARRAAPATFAAPPLYAPRSTPWAPPPSGSPARVVKPQRRRPRNASLRPRCEAGGCAGRAVARATRLVRQVLLQAVHVTAVCAARKIARECAAVARRLRVLHCRGALRF